MGINLFLFMVVEESDNFKYEETSARNNCESPILKLYWLYFSVFSSLSLYVPDLRYVIMKIGFDRICHIQKKSFNSVLMLH